MAPPVDDDAPGEPPYDPAIDLYHEAHKGLRAALFAVTVRAGRGDANDASAVTGLQQEWRQVARDLGRHHHAEERVCTPLVARHAPELLDGLDADHATCADLVAQLDRLCATLGEAPDRERPALLRRLYLELCMLCSRYLDHLAYEEDQVMPALRLTMSAEQLRSAREALRAEPE